MRETAPPPKREAAGLFSYRPRCGRITARMPLPSAAVPGGGFHVAQVRVVVLNGGASSPKRAALLIVPCEDNVLCSSTLIEHGDDVAAPVRGSFHSPLVLPGDGVGHFLPRGSHVRVVAPRAVAVFLAAEENR